MRVLEWKTQYLNIFLVKKKHSSGFESHKKNKEIEEFHLKFHLKIFHFDEARDLIEWQPSHSISWI